MLLGLLLVTTVALATDQPSSAAGQTAIARPPVLNIEAPAALSTMGEDLRAFDSESLLPIMRLLGMRDPGPPVRVVVAPEGSAEADVAPPWAVAYAVGEAGLVVLIPGRIPSYPDDDMPEVLRHEIAHVLIARAAGRRPVPRWLNEGLAVYASRGWQLEDAGRVTWATLLNDRTMDEVDAGFAGGPVTAARSYALAAAFVRFLLERDGEGTAAHILSGVAEGRSFDQAFRQATGQSLAVAEADFRDHLSLWHRWLPLISSSTFGWLLIAGLAVLAFHRRRQRNAERMAEWEAEEQPAEIPPDGWIN